MALKLRFLLHGFWLSVPIAVLVLLALFAEIKSLAVFVWIGLIMGLPWGIPAIFMMMWVGLVHGVPETQQIIGFWVGLIWIFLSITINGALLSRSTKLIKIGILDRLFGKTARKSSQKIKGTLNSTDSGK